MPQRDYLSFERTPRPEEVQEDPPEQIEKLEHPAFIARFGRSGQADGICGRDTEHSVSERWERRLSRQARRRRSYIFCGRSMDGRQHDASLQGSDGRDAL